MKSYRLKPKSQAPTSPPLSAPAPSPDAGPERQDIVGIDLHPDVFDAAVLRQGTRAKDARLVASHNRESTADLAQWAAQNLDPAGHLLVLESTAGSTEAVLQLAALGFVSVVLESTQAGRLADTVCETDRVAAERIARLYLTGLAKTVWTPDPATRERRELLGAYQRAVTEQTRAVNELKSYLSEFHIRPGKRNLEKEPERQWVRRQFGERLGAVREAILEGHFAKFDAARAAVRRYYRLICREMAGHRAMLACLRVVGVGLISSFGVLAVVGDIKRFATPAKFVSYLGLNPCQRRSGNGKETSLGVGQRGRKDLRGLLIQGAQALLRQSGCGRHPLANWGFRLFARKGNRNVAVAGIARRMAHKLYHILKGREIEYPEQAKPLRRKLSLLSIGLGTEGRQAAGIPAKTADAVNDWLSKLAIPMPISINNPFPTQIEPV